MYVIATAGHVDHGKSALVRRLTGMEPDRWEQERRRGLTIDLGYAWLTLRSGQRVAFVDVPGHERFVPNMLAGVGPVPAVLFVVAADGGWMPQSEEHLAAIDALGISRGLLAVTRADLADPGPALRAARQRIARTSLREVEAVAVSSVTGQGVGELLDALGRLVSQIPAPDPAAPVRLWVDRAFTIKGSGTVVTGTLPAGTVRVRDELLATPSQRTVRVRGLQSLKERAEEVSGVARVALNLRGVEAGTLGRGTALVAPGAWTLASVIDVRLGPVPAGLSPPRELSLHIGAARTTARMRVLVSPHRAGGHDGRVLAGGAGSGTGAGQARAGTLIARLTLRQALPLHVGDRVLLRVPGSAPPPGEGPRRLVWPPLTGATVLDVAPPAFAGRGAVAAAGRELESWPGVPSGADLLRRRGLARVAALRALGVDDHPPPVTGDWLADPGYWAVLRDRLTAVVAAHAEKDPLATGMPIDAARAALRVPDRRLVEALVSPPLVFAGGVLNLAGGQAGADGDPQAEQAEADVPAAAGASRGAAGPGGPHAGGPVPVVGPALPERVMVAVRALRRELADAPFLAPPADRLRELGLDAKSLAAAGRAGLLLRVSDQIVLAPGADTDAAELLAGLPQPFTTAQARQVLGTTRRVAIPLLEYLDRAGVTRRLPDDRRMIGRRTES